MVNHSLEMGPPQGESPAVKAHRNRSRHERTTDCCRGLSQARCAGSGEHRSDVSQHLCASATEHQNIKGTLKFIRIHRGHKVASTLMVEPINRRFVTRLRASPRTTRFP